MRKIKIICATLALIMALCALNLTSCSKGTEVIMSISDGEIEKTIDLNTYKFLLSRMKGTLEYYDYDVDSASFWRTIISSDGKTWDEHFSNTIFEQTKLYLTVEYLFEKEGLTLDSARAENVESMVDSLIKKSGSVTALNSELKKYGVNVDMLRNIYITEQKFSQLITHFYGENGEKIATLEKNKFFSENYVAFGQIFLPIYENVKDANGKEQAKYFDEAKCKEILENAKKYSSECDGNLSLFKEYAEKYSKVEGSGDPTYLFIQSEYYGFQDQSAAYLDTMAKELSKMAIGECKVISSPYGYHVICRYEREAEAYDNKDYEEIFSDFYAMLSDKLFNEKCAKFANKIVVYDEVKRPNISTVKSNRLY